MPGDPLADQALGPFLIPGGDGQHLVDELGNLGLGEREEDALVEFKKALDDGHRP